MTVDFAMRNLDASIDVLFDLRAGAVDGPIIFSGHDLLTTPLAVPWSNDARQSRAAPGINEDSFPV